jgi:hypothetical protein
MSYLTVSYRVRREWPGWRLWTYHVAGKYETGNPGPFFFTFKGARNAMNRSVENLMIVCDAGGVPNSSEKSK